MLGNGVAGSEGVFLREAQPFSVHDATELAVSIKATWYSC